jgi:hypothetical protein
MNIETNGLSLQINFSEPDVENWVHASIKVSVPNFSGSYSCTIQVDEILALRDMFINIDSQLGKEVSAQWCNMEDNIYLSLKLDKMGNIEGAYKLSSNVISIGPTLSGEFEADQSYLLKWASQLRGVTSAGS